MTTDREKTLLSAFGTIRELIHTLPDEHLSHMASACRDMKDVPCWCGCHVSQVCGGRISVRPTVYNKDVEYEPAGKDTNR